MEFAQVWLVYVASYLHVQFGQIFAEWLYWMKMYAYTFSEPPSLLAVFMCLSIGLCLRTVWEEEVVKVY